MIDTEGQARAVAEKYIADVVEPAVGEEVITTAVREFPTCWIVGYNTRAYVETQAISHALAGGPIIVNRASGKLRVGSSALPAEEQLDP
jgi:hypothetical protein